MGLDINGARFLLAEKKRGLTLGRLLTLGRQEVYMTHHDYDSVLKDVGLERTVQIYGDDFFRGLGATSLEVMDASSYEGAEVIHDLNEPLGSDLQACFDTVIDGGTLEHVFHFPNSIKSCMELVKPGGHLILMTPWHNYAGHGFYQFSPELFYSILSPTNGYMIERMLMVSEGYWYAIRNPAEIQRRIEISTSDSINLYILAKRITSKDIFQTWPQQSDYSAAWKQGSYGHKTDNSSKTLKDKIVGRYTLLQSLQSKWRRFKAGRLLSPSKNPGMERLCRSNRIPCE